MKRARLLAALTLAVGVGLGLAVNLPSHWGGSQSSDAPISPQASQLHGGNRGRAHAIAEKKEDPVAAIAEILKLVEEPPNSWRELQWQVYDRFAQMSADEIKLALTELHNSTELELNELDMLREPLLLIWSRMDGVSCLEYALTLKEEGDHGIYRERLMGEALISWAHRDPHGAYEWLLEHQTIFRHDNGASEQRYVLLIMAEHNMAAALHELRQIPDEADRRYMYDIIDGIGAMAGRDAAARREFTEFLETFENSLMRYRGRSGLVKAWASTDLKEALQHVSAQQPGTLEHQAGERGLMSAWMAKDPQAALDWKVKNPSPEKQEGYQDVSIYLRDWAYHEPEAANQWLAKQPAEFLTDELYDTLSWGSTARRYPNYAIQWAMKIQNKSKRHECLRSIGGSLRHEEWGAQWMEGLEPQIRDEIAKALERDH